MTAAAVEAGGWLAALALLTLAAAMRLELSRRGRLIAHACHELRGPLAAARLGLAMLARPGERPAARAAAIDHELRRAGLALEDLDAARHGRRAEAREGMVDVAALARVGAEAWRPVALAVGGDIRVQESGDPVMVRGDRVRLAQAMGNLLANAIEHGGGRVELRARMQAGRVRLEVHDEGAGLPDSIGRLSARRSGRSGRGHGLAIAADVAARHGGRLACAPSPRGARLVLELPAAA